MVQLDERCARLQAQIISAHQQFQQVRMAALGKYGVSDVEQLKALLAQRKAEVPAAPALARVAGTTALTGYLMAQDAAGTHRSALLALVWEHVVRHAPRGTFLDLGSGTGTFAAAMSQSHPEARILCLEPDAGFHAGYPQQLSLSTTLDDIPDELDGIYSLNLLEYLPDTRPLMRAIADKLRPGGRAFFLLAAHEALWSEEDVALGRQRRYSRESARRLADEAGLFFQAEGEFDPLGFWLAEAEVLQEKYRHLDVDSVADRNAITRHDRMFRWSDAVLRLLHLPGSQCWISMMRPENHNAFA